MKKISFFFLVIFGISFVLTGCSDKDVEEGNNEDIIIEQSDNFEEITTNMKDLYKGGGEKTCEFVFNDDGIAMEGTIYIDGKIIKTETKINFGENIILGNTLVKDDYTYTRDNTNTQAWKISNEDDSIEDEDSYIEEENNDNLENMEIIFKCKEGVSNKNVFELPTDLEFKEFNDMAGIDYLDDLEY